MSSLAPAHEPLVCDLPFRSCLPRAAAAMEHPDCGLGLGAAPRSDLPPTPPPSRVGSVAINKGPSSNLERGTSGVAHTYTLLGSQPAYKLNSGGATCQRLKPHPADAAKLSRA